MQLLSKPSGGKRSNLKNFTTKFKLKKQGDTEIGVETQTINKSKGKLVSNKSKHQK